MKKKHTVKISKYLADCGVGSRRRCEELVAAGKVIVNGRRMRNVAERINPEIDIVSYKGKKLRVVKKEIFIFYKPVGYVSTMSDIHAKKTVAELIPKKFNWLGLKPVGRLDKQSEGLMILTNDGQLALRLTHPRYGIEKTYRVELDRAPTERVLDLVRKGVHLATGEKLQPMKVKVAGKGRKFSSALTLVLKEGKKREIRRAFELFRYEVKKLKRIAIGPLNLGKIRKGQIVPVSPAQEKKIRTACGLESLQK